MSWLTYYAVTAAVLLAGFGARQWYRTALARQSARDAQALAAEKFGRRFLTPEMGLPHDQAKAEIAHVVAKRTERRQRKVAASRASAPAKPAAPAKVTQIRRAR